MAIFQILYWQDIPSQIKVWDDFEEINLELAQEFASKIDRTAKSKGLTNADDYLAQWHWTDQQECEGEPQVVAEAIKTELENDKP